MPYQTRFYLQIVKLLFSKTGKKRRDDRNPRVELRKAQAVGTVYASQQPRTFIPVASLRGSVNAFPEG